MGEQRPLSKSSQSAPASEGGFVSGKRLPGEGDSDCVVVLQSDGAVVRKTFLTSARQDGPQAARREYAYLQRWRAALADVEGATCPEPLGLSLGPVAEVRMVACPGMHVDSYVRTHRMTDAACAALADRMAVALCRYVAVFGEPYYDFFARNLLYDEDSDMLYLFDMGIPAGVPELMAGLPPLAVSLGNFTGHVLRDMVRPRRIASLTGNRRALRLTRQLVRGVFAAGEGRRHVREAALRSYRRTTGTGADRVAPAHRRAWYRSAEIVLVRPLLGRLLRGG